MHTPIGPLPKAGMMDTTDQTTGSDDFDITPQFSDMTLRIARAEVNNIRLHLGLEHPVVESENYSSDGTLAVGDVKFQLVNGDNNTITLRVANGDQQIGEYAFDANEGLNLGDFLALTDAVRQTLDTLTQN